MILAFNSNILYVTNKTVKIALQKRFKESLIDEGFKGGLQKKKYCN